MATKRATKTSSPAKTRQASSQRTTRSTSSAAVRKAPLKKVERSVLTPVVTSHKNEMSSASSQWDRKQIFRTLRRPQILIPVAILLAIIVVYLLKSWFVVALVNGQLITRPEVDSALEQQYGKETVSNLIAIKLIEQEAARQHITIPQSYVDQQIKTAEKNAASQGQTFDQVLAANGITRADLERNIRLNATIQKLLGDKIKVTDKEVEDYINANKDTLPSGETDAQLKAAVLPQLQQQKLQTQEQGLVQKLESQAHITNFINF